MFAAVCLWDVWSNVCQMFEMWLSLGPSGHSITLYHNVSHTEGFKHLRDIYKDVCHTYSICFNSACNSPMKTRLDSFSCWCKPSSIFFFTSPTSTLIPLCYVLMPLVTTLIIFYFLSLHTHLPPSHPHAVSAHTITLPTESSTSNQEWNGAAWGMLGWHRKWEALWNSSQWVFYIQCHIFPLKSQPAAVHYQFLFLVSIQSRLAVGR